MARVLLQIDFPFDGPFGAEMTDALTGLAQSIADEPGLVWKIWTENADTKTAGGIYLFQSMPEAQTYCQKHCARLQKQGVKDIRSHFFMVNEALSRIDRAPESCFAQ